METWTVVRFFLYPILMVIGLVLAWSFFRQYRVQRLPAQGFAATLALGTGTLGMAGFGALALSEVANGFNGWTSFVLTTGLAALTGAALYVLVMLAMAAWKRNAYTETGDA